MVHLPLGRKRTPPYDPNSAYWFGDKHGYGNEIRAIIEKEIDSTKFKQSSIRRGYIIELLEAKGIFEEFKDKCWEWGNKNEGAKKRLEYLKLKNDFENDVHSKRETSIANKVIEKDRSDKNLPDKDACGKAIKELNSEGKPGTNENVLDRIQQNDPYKGSKWHPDWRKMTLENMKQWSC